MFDIILFLSIPIIQKIIHKLLHKRNNNNNNQINNQINDCYKLDRKYIDEFIRNGVVVIPGILTENEIIQTRNEFHLSLKNHGVSSIISFLFF